MVHFSVPDIDGNILNAVLGIVVVISVGTTIGNALGNTLGFVLAFSDGLIIGWLAVMLALGSVLGNILGISIFNVSRQDAERIPTSKVCAVKSTFDTTAKSDKPDIATIEREPVYPYVPLATYVAVYPDEERNVLNALL